MDRNKRALVEILSLAIRGQEIKDLEIKKVDWDIVLKEAMAHDVHSLLYTVLKEVKINSDSWNKFITTLKMITIKTGVSFIQHNQEISKVLSSLKEAGIPVIAFKGIVLKDLYPYPELRTMGDTDLLVPIEYLDLGRNIIEQLGYYEDIPDAKCIHFNHKVCMPIELHWELLNHENYKNKMDSFEKDVWNNIIPATVCGVQIYTLGLIDQMLHLILHMAFHILNEGFGLRQLCDFVLYTESVSDTINWKEFWIKSEKLGIAPFTSAIFEVSNQLFGLKIPLIVNKYKHQQIVIQYLTSEIIRSGTFGNHAMKWRNSSNMLHFGFKNVSMRGKFINLLKFIPILFKELPYYSYSKLFIDKQRKKLLNCLDLK